MDPRLIPQMIAALAFFGFLVICPLVMLFLRHQRLMAEMIHSKASNESLQRLELVERELRELRSLHHVRAIQEDEQRELRQRVT